MKKILSATTGKNNNQIVNKDYVHFTVFQMMQQGCYKQAVDRLGSAGFRLTFTGKAELDYENKLEMASPQTDFVLCIFLSFYVTLNISSGLRLHLQNVF